MRCFVTRYFIRSEEGTKMLEPDLYALCDEKLATRNVIWESLT
jgi:hypothetical protein